jgi:restriction endonuclease Mrr
MQPDFQTLLLPLLESLKEVKWYSAQDIQHEVKRYIDFSDGALKTSSLATNGRDFESAWMQALETLGKAGLIEKNTENHVRVTSLGKLVISKRLNAIDINFLRRLPGFIENE